MSADGFVIVDKASGMTSHDVVAIARRALGTKKVGHAGTLDPMATGVLVLGFGIGTRLLQYITDGEKAYDATIVLGASTVTDDADGEVIQVCSPEKLSEITDEMISNSLSRMRGVISQRPSSVSAVKVGGKRAYARVRDGEDVELPPREVTISHLEVTDTRRSHGKIEVDISVVCGAGTFIRAIARDCGDDLGVGGHLVALRRILVSPFSLTRANSVEQLKRGEINALSVEEVAMMRFPIRNVTEEESRELSFGRALEPSGSDEVTAAFWNGRLIALLSNKESKANPIAVFTSN